MSLDTNELNELLQSEELCYMSTTFPDGGPHVVPIWFVREGDTLVFMTNKTTRWFQNIQHDNQVAVCFGGRKTYLVRGMVNVSNMANESGVEKLFRKKYAEQVQEQYFTEDTRVHRMTVRHERSWH